VSAAPEQLPSVSRFEWERIIRQLSLPPMTKLIAMTLATYCTGATGQSMYPGEERLAADCCVSVRTVRRHLADLRDTGLIVRTARGRANQYGRTADTHVLALPVDIADRVPLTKDHPALRYPGRFGWVTDRVIGGSATGQA
jgi:hypothetical protein